MANGPDPSAYRRAVIRVRGAVQQLDEDAVRTILAALEALGEGLEGELSSTLGGLSESDLARQRAAEASREVIRGQYQAMLGELGPALEDHRDVAFERVLEIWEETAMEVAGRLGVAEAAGSAIRAAPINLVGLYDGLGAADTWRTLLRGHVENAASEADRIVRLGLAEGVGPDELSRRLRRYVTGSEQFDDLFEEVPTLTGDVAKIDLRKVSATVRRQAGTMRFNARRIAFTESQNARGEAEVQHYLKDPLIEGIRRVLSPNRGVSFSGPDECDVLAGQDLYGMGRGVYPIGKAPPLAVHPFDRCEHRTVLREPSRMGEEKPVPSSRKSGADVDVPGADRLTDNRIQWIRENTEDALQRGELAWEEIQRRAA